MPALTPTRRRARPLRYAPLFPDWSGPRPVAFFLLEQLLETRRAGDFPTNSHGPDEEVNVYLAHLLTRHLSEPIGAGAGPVTRLPAGGRRDDAERWRRGGDHRLLALGLYGWGDLARRRRIPWGLGEQESRRRDLADGRTCYELAARAAPKPLAPVLRQLARRFEDYVRGLQVLAVDRLGLGARLSPAALRDLATASPAIASLTAGPAMDAYLDRLLEHRRAPSAATRAALDAAARRAGIAADQVS